MTTQGFAGVFAVSCTALFLSIYCYSTAGKNKFGSIVSAQLSLLGMVIGTIYGWQVVSREILSFCNHFIFPFSLFSVIVCAMIFTTLFPGVVALLNMSIGDFKEQPITIFIWAVGTGYAWYRFSMWVISNDATLGQGVVLAVLITIGGVIPHLAKFIIRKLESSQLATA